MPENTILVPKDCGKHYGIAGGPCHKCAAQYAHYYAHPECYQASGPPFIAALSPATESEQR